MGKRVLFLALLALAAILGLTGCGSSSSSPSIDQARKLVVALYPGSKVIDFTKTNGEAKVVEGQNTYVYHFLVAFELPAGIGWRQNFHALPGGFVYTGPDSARSAVPIVPLPAGTIGVGMGTITFKETEKGWTDDLKKDDGYCPPKTPPQVCYQKLGWDKSN